LNERSINFQGMSVEGPGQDDSEGTRRPGRPRLAEGDEGAVRERLLDAATSLALEHGFDACGLREIAARADVSPGMIAYYFGDREGLHEAMFQRAFDRVTDAVRRLVEAEASGDGEDRLDELIRIHVSALAADPWLAQLIARDVLASVDSPIRRRAAERLGTGPLQLVVGWIEEEQRRGLLREDLDPRLVAVSIASLCAFPFLMLPVVGETIGLELDVALADRWIEHVRALVDRGIRTRPGEGSREGTA
jgi:AcrR family transcriptional regulator